MLGGLHKPTGVAHILRFGFAELRSSHGSLSLRDLCTYTDYLAVALLDLADASGAAPESNTTKAATSSP